MKKDQNQVIKIERAIAEKYGEEAIQNPKAEWDDEKEKDYLLQLKELYTKENKRREATERIEKEGFFVSKKLLNKESNRKCPVCEAYSFKVKDDLYMQKFECCFKCYIQWVEGREKRWIEGWRPPNLKGEK